VYEQVLVVGCLLYGFDFPQNLLSLQYCFSLFLLIYTPWILVYSHWLYKQLQFTIYFMFFKE